MAPPKPIGIAGKAAPSVTSPLTVENTSYTGTAVPPIGVEQALTVPVQMMPTPTTTANLPAVVLTLEDAEKAGGNAQMQIANATQKIVAVAKTSDMDELGTLLGETLTLAKGYDPTSLNHQKGGVFGWFKRKSESLRQRYETVDNSVQRMVGEIDKRVALFSGRVADLANIGTQNRSYHDSLTPEIERLNAGVAYMEANIPDVDPTDPFSAQKSQEWQTVIAWARKRADDLRRAQIVAQQQDAQINLMQQNSRALTQKFRDLKVTTLPILQQSFTLYIINLEQAAGAEFATKIDDLTDETLKQNAAKLGQNTVNIHTALNRSNISMDAIQANHDAVIKALDDIERIRLETKTRLANEAPLLEQKSRELAARLAQPPK